MNDFATVRGILRTSGNRPKTHFNQFKLFFLPHTLKKKLAFVYSKEA